jgi:hypothetical protein
MGADSIVNTLSAAWTLIKDNQPTAEIAATKCNAVPDVNDWQDLGPLSAPTPIATRFIKNISPLGFTNVDCQLDLVYQYGATYKGGGAFIPALWITVDHCNVALLFNLNVSLRVISVGNANPGTSSPISQLTVQITEHVTNHLGSSTKSADFMVFGDGRNAQISRSS